MKIKVAMSYYGFDHEQVKKHFDGEPEFVNEFCVNDEYAPVAVYRAKKVNRKKGHKKYLLLQTQKGPDGKRQILVRGMSAPKMEEWRYQEGVHCLQCGDVIYSVNRHDCHHCSCGAVMVDGGRDYLRCGWNPGTMCEGVVIDLLKNKVSKVGKRMGDPDGLTKATQMAKDRE